MIMYTHARLSEAYSIAKKNYRNKNNIYQAIDWKQARAGISNVRSSSTLKSISVCIFYKNLVSQRNSCNKAIHMMLQE
jgi:hypothetical protein